MTTKKVLSAGQCGFDHGSISRTFAKSFRAEVVSADTYAAALEQMRQGPFALVLVNRVFDADGSSGLDFIWQIKTDEKLRSVPVMLVSNYEEAQAEAVLIGALPGFGKAALGQALMMERVRAIIGNV